MIKEEDHSTLRKILTDLAPLTDNEWLMFQQLIQVKNFSKKECFQEAGKKCKTVGFLIEGCFRWVKTVNGEERTFDFAIENDFVTNYHSVITQQPCEVDIVAVEKSVVACMDACKLLQLFDTTFNWQKIGRHLAENVACYSLERLIDSYYQTPKARYEKLMDTSPKLFLRIPHHILANYLGMTKETLSRLRNSVK